MGDDMERARLAQGDVPDLSEFVQPQFLAAYKAWYAAVTAAQGGPMSDVRVRLAEALRGHQRNPYGQHDGWWECSCSTDEPHTPEHLADVLLSLEGVAIVALPEPTGTHNSGLCFDKEVRTYKDRVLIDTDYDISIGYARALAAALLAAAAAAEAVKQ